MAQEERLKYLINYLLNEQPEYSNINIPESLEDKKQLLRSLMTVSYTHLSLKYPVTP